MASLPYVILSNIFCRSSAINQAGMAMTDDDLMIDLSISTTMAGRCRASVGTDAFCVDRSLVCVAMSNVMAMFFLPAFLLYRYLVCVELVIYMIDRRDEDRSGGRTRRSGEILGNPLWLGWAMASWCSAGSDYVGVLVFLQWLYIPANGPG